MTNDVKLNERGFERIDFKDIYEFPCSLQTSSIAYEAIWLGCNENAEPHHVTHKALSPRMHLGKHQVESLVAHLTAWLKTGSFELPMSNP